MAEQITVVGGLITIVIALVREIVVPRSRLDEWQEYAYRERARADQLQAELAENTKQMGRMADALEALRSERR